MSALPAKHLINEDTNFIIGDVVRLVSDKIRMTVHFVEGAKIICRWHDQSDDLLSDEFDPRELILISKAE